MSYITKDGIELSEETLDELAEHFERGELPGRVRRVLVGRPRISLEQLKLIGAKVPESLVDAFDRKASAHGQTRSQRIRQLIERDVSEA
ncbi:MULTISPECIES: ribbon-helix-helix protein, CopG family [Atopobiaceae]|uniref:ribbon-helix-helix protein, CopG family n=1 Tax=Atopobiaceae TaxID=1643824 RepID=UPI000B382F04|nr:MULTISPECIES: ribbon-helix-helix protein, CopG family [Atopobiaceae]MCR8907252.1 ribbon-helix-helix protein, CopG family [Thermophilibacter sp. ET337]OUO33848.1 hypothetical protein B5F85_00555 [Olsenella sp. An293]